MPSEKELALEYEQTITRAMRRRRMALGGAASDPYSYVNDETRTYVAAMSSKPNDTDKGRYDTFIGALKSASIWNAIDCLYLCGGHDAQAGLLNVRYPGSYTLTAVNSPVFTAYQGYQPSNGGAYLTSNWDPATNAVAMLQDSAHIFGYVRDDPTGDANQDIGSGTTTYMAVRPQGNVNSAVARVTGSTVITSIAPGVTAPLMVMGIRRSAVPGTVLLWRDGASNTSGASVSSALTTDDFNLGRHNGSLTDRQIFAAGWGAELNDTQAAAYYTALNALAVAFGADT